MVGRTGFVGDLLYSFGVSGFIYPIIGHWAWGPDGWLTTSARRRSTTSRAPRSFTPSAASSPSRAAIALGPRIGRKFKRDGGGAMPGHDMTIAAIGGVILWFGWYGFNPGSTLSAMDLQGCGRVAANTTLAACAGGLSALFYMYPRNKVWDCGMTVNGFLAGLVAITCPCYWVSPTGAIILGGVAGVVCVLAVDLMEWLRLDDPVGAVAVHGACGIWGTLSLGLLACGKYGAPTPTGADNSAARRHRPLLRRRHRAARRAVHRQRVRSPARPSPSRMILMYAVKAHGHSPRLQGGRARRARPPRARRPGVPGDPHRLRARRDLVELDGRRGSAGRGGVT